MQSATHILSGVFIAKLIFFIFPALSPVILYGLAAILAFFSHYVLDSVAIITYHPLETHWDDPFYKWYHILFVFVLGGILFGVFFIPYWWAMICAMLPDIVDWYTLRPIWKRGPVFHPSVDKFRAKFFAWVPNKKDEKWTIGLEIGLDILLFVGILLL